MGTVRLLQAQRSRRARDEELREAHHDAFQKIREARTSGNATESIAQAVQELVDACEAYVSKARH